MKRLFVGLLLACNAIAITPANTNLDMNPIPGERMRIKRGWYNEIKEAIILVESGGDSLALGKDNDLGLFQITPIRVKDYNQLTGKDYKHEDMICPEISEEIFYYYASKIGIHPITFERIAREWNGGYAGMKKASTQKYWQKVKYFLNK